MDQASEIKLGRVGHYFSPNSSEGEELSGGCQKADIVKVWTAGLVNLDVVDANAHHEARTSVNVEAPQRGQASFHLNRDCPWFR